MVVSLCSVNLVTDFSAPPLPKAYTRYFISTMATPSLINRTLNVSLECHCQLYGYSLLSLTREKSGRDFQMPRRGGTSAMSCRAG